MSSDDGFSTFAGNAAPTLLRAAWFLTGDRHAAEDLVQNALLKVYLRWGRLHDGQPLAYAKRCLLTERTDRHRKGWRELFTGAALDRSVPPDTTPEARTDLVRALARLPRREREVVVMRYYADLSERDVADALGISLGSVKSSASRGLAKLRETLSLQEDSHA